MQKTILFFLCVACLTMAQEKNYLLDGDYYYMEINSKDGESSSAISKITFNGTDSAFYKTIWPETFDSGYVEYTISENGELNMPFGEIMYHGAVKSDGEIFFMALTEATGFSDFGIGIGVKENPGIQTSDLKSEYKVSGLIPTSSLGSFTFNGGAEDDSVFSYSGELEEIFDGDIKFRLEDDGVIFFDATETDSIDNTSTYTAASVFNSTGKLGIASASDGGTGLFAAVNNSVNLDGTYLNKKLRYAQFLTGDYEDASVLELNCYDDGTGDYSKIYYSNPMGDTTGSFTYEILNNNLMVYEDGDTLVGSFTDDFNVHFLVRNVGGTFGLGIGIAEIDDAVSVESRNDVPQNFMLQQNYPNPFNPTTTIKYSIPNVGARSIVPVRLKIFNLLGQEVATLVNEQQPAGNYEVKFDGSNLASGIYLYKLSAGEFTSVKKLLLIK